jgi:hypothetical protein
MRTTAILLKNPLHLKRLFRTILILSVGLFVSYRIIRHVDHEVIFDDEVNFGFSIVALGIFVWTLLNDRKEYIKGKSLTAFIPTAFGVFIGIGLLTTLFILQQRDKSPSKLYCVSKIVDFNGVSIDFREDGSYKLTSWCLGADYYRGSYTISDSIITLDKTAIEKVIESNRLLIRQDGEIGRSGNREMSIYQIDKDGQVIRKATDFRVLDKPKW